MTTPCGGTDASARFNPLDALRPDAVPADPDGAASIAEMLVDRDGPDRGGYFLGRMRTVLTRAFAWTLAGMEPSAEEVEDAARIAREAGIDVDVSTPERHRFLALLVRAAGAS